MPILAQLNPFYRPSMRIISNITNSNPGVCTTTFPHGYIDGLIMRLDIPLEYGMQQANRQQGEITILSPTTFSIALDTTYYDPFVNQPTGPQYAQVVNVGELNSQLTGAVQNVQTR